MDYHYKRGHSRHSGVVRTIKPWSEIIIVSHFDYYNHDWHRQWILPKKVERS